MSDWPALLSETGSFSVVHLELGLLKGPKIARPLKGELLRGHRRDPSRSSPGRLCWHRKTSTTNPQALFSSCASYAFLGYLPLPLVLKIFLRRLPARRHPFSADFQATACVGVPCESALSGNVRTI